VRILLTGATGSFGRFIARTLLARGCEVVAVARGRDDVDAEQRVLAAVGFSRRLSVVRGDLGMAGLGLEELPRLDGVLHAAASTSFAQPLAAARHANVDATRNVLQLCLRLPQPPPFGFVSTAFVAGRRVGRILESELRHDAGFVTPYEQSKYEAELVVRAHMSLFPISIFRPSVVVDPPTRSRPQGQSAFRFVLDLIARGLLPVLPGDGDDRFDLVAAPDAAAAVAHLYLDGPAGGVYHVASGDDAPALADVVRAARRPVRFVNSAFPKELELLRRLHPRAAPAYDQLATFIGVLGCPKIFDTTALERELGHSLRHEGPIEAVA
jgi:nucleoside-diphosphate-sugar epimerase